MSTPGIVIGAPCSGSGKTTIATGLIGALRRAGRRVAPFKVGPDFIDPGYHALAAGRPGRNLDPVLVGEDLIGPLYRYGSAGADIAVIEGGAQGEHKLARGLEPVQTQSVHWLAHPGFADAVDKFLERERAGVDNYLGSLSSPFRSEVGD